MTIPAPVREALGIRRGSRLLFRVEEERIVIKAPGSGRIAEVETLPDFFALAGSVPVPPTLRGASWETVRRLGRAQRAGRGAGRRR